VFVSTATALYLGNQDEFQRQAAVLWPFAVAAVATVSIGAVLYFTSDHRASRWLLWAYYLVAPFFLLFSFLQNWSMGGHFFLWFFGTWPGVLTLGAAFLATTAFLASRLDFSQVRAPLALFSLLALVAEGHSFATRLEPPTVRPPNPTPDRGLESRDDLPNIYHLIFDGYDARDFLQTLDAATRDALKGFVNFPANLAIYRSTRMSLPSIFEGRRKPADVSSHDYMERAFNSRESLLHWLREEGYRTLAYVPRLYAFELGLFDRVTYDRDNLRTDALLAINSASFQRLWLFLNTPRLVTRQFLGRRWFDRFGGDGLALVRDGARLPFSVPITSYLSFLSLLDDEARLPDRGRYTLIHLVIPHRPEALASDCSYDEGGRGTSQLEQARCATKLLRAFVERLEELGRLNDSLVVVHSDHGAYEEVDELEAHAPERVSLHALLLVKPIGRRGDMVDSRAATTVLDIAPTVLAGVGVEHELQMDGTSLLDPSRVPELQSPHSAPSGGARPPAQSR
jgi:hypothetical protein